MFRAPLVARSVRSLAVSRTSAAIARPYLVRCSPGLAARGFHVSLISRDIPSWPNPPVPQPPVGGADDFVTTLQGQEKSGKKQSFWEEWSHSAGFQAALTTVVGLGLVFLAGVGYLEWYKAHVLHRVERAFAGGYDPALELSSVHSPKAEHISRREQPLVGAIMRGEEAGGYYLIIGPKGTGKTTLLLDGMRKTRAEGASVCEAHPDLEVFRLRFGKALDFDFFEDWQGSLFSRADPRNGGPSLDIERAMTKLEKVALRYTRKNGRPLVMAFTNIHLFPNTEEGHALVQQLQQRAEGWAQAGIMTMIFTTDDHWPLDKLKKNASRMRILSVYDLSAKESINALRHMRRYNLSVRENKPLDEVEIESDDVLRRIYEMIGGRTSFITRVARATNMVEEAEHMIKQEKGWMLSKIGLIPEMDDDVMDEQKWATCSWLLLRHLADQIPPLDPPMDEMDEQPEDANEGIHLTPSVVDLADSTGSTSALPVLATTGKTLTEEELHKDLVLPAVSYDEARRHMTRTDFFIGLDHDNIISIDLHHDVRPDSVLILRAAQECIAKPDFDSMLNQARDRVDEIEGLHRQSELTVKEPFRITRSFDDLGRLVVDVIGLGGSFVPAEDEEDEDAEEGGDKDDGAGGDEKAGEMEGEGEGPDVPEWIKGTKRLV